MEERMVQCPCGRDGRLSGGRTRVREHSENGGLVPFQTRSRRAEKPDTHIVDCWHVRLRAKARLVKGVVLAGKPSSRLSTPTLFENHLLPVYNSL